MRLADAVGTGVAVALAFGLVVEVGPGVAGAELAGAELAGAELAGGELAGRGDAFRPVRML